MGYLIAGIFAGIVAVFIAAWMVYSVLDVLRYERAVKGYLGDDTDCYIENVMYDFYDAERGAADCARELKAMHYED